jgi:HD superfamily phosphodiesterase
MSERISSWKNFEHDDNKIVREADKVGDQALDIVDRRYGCGYPSWRPGSHELSYHNGHHARAVGDAALKVCTRMGLSRPELAVAKAAGYSHDLVQLKGRGRDERESAEWFEYQLEKARVFPEPLRHIGGLAIKGTEPIFSGKRIVGQMATRLDYPDKDARLLGLGVACGDFGELYTPEGPLLSHQLFREIKGMPREQNIPFDEITDFQRGQVQLLETYKYPHPTGESTLATHRRQVTTFAKTILRQLESGTIESWPELIERDMSFIRQLR